MGYVCTGMGYHFSALLFSDIFALMSLSTACAPRSFFFVSFLFLPPDFFGHNDHVFYRSIATMAVFYRNADGLHYYWDGLPLQCTSLF